jgi:hypothetical protein
MFEDVRTGASLLASHAGALVAALLLAAIDLALGARLRRLLGSGAASNSGDVSDPGHATSSIASWPVDLVLGAGALATLLLLVGIAGQLTSAGVLIATAVAAVVVRRELVEVLRASPALFSRRYSLFIGLIVLLLAAALAPPTEWDSLMYHLRIPLGFLEEGRVSQPVDSFHVSLVGLAHFSTLPLLALDLRNGPALMQVIAFAAVGGATVRLARQAGGSSRAELIALATLIGCPVFVLVAITARVDVTLVLALLSAHLVLVSAEPGDRRALRLAAVLIGAAVAIKPQAGAYALALIPIGWRVAGGARTAAIAVLVATVVAAPWLAKNQWLVGAPFHPIGAPDHFEPWIATLFGGRELPAGVDDSVLGALAAARAEFNLLDAFFEPGRITVEGEGGFYALSPALLLLPLALLAVVRDPKRRAGVGVGLVGVAYLALLLVPFPHTNLRYLMPALPALAVALAVGSDGILRFIEGRARPLALQLLALGLGLVAIRPVIGAIRHRYLAGDAVLLRHALGFASAQEVWRRHPDGTARSLAPVIANVHATVPREGKLLMLWEARGLAFDRPSLVDVRLTNWSFLAQSNALETCLAGTGVTHILAGAGSVEFYVARGADAAGFHLGRFTPFRERCLVGHRTVGPGFELFRLRSPAATPGAALAPAPLARP